MKRVSWALGIIAIACVATAIAQPPGGPGGPGGGPGGRGGGGMGGPPPNPVVEALDTDHDRVISSDELKNATTSLLTLDKNNDGKLTENEFAPFGGGRGMGPGQGGGRTGNGRRPGQGGAGGPGGPGGRPPGGGPPGGGPDDGPPGPNPERMVDHAMEFDADKDGKLSREELTKFAEDFAAHHPGPGGPPGAGPGGPGGPPGSNDGQPSQRPKRPD